MLASDGRTSISVLGTSELASMDDRKQRKTRTGANKGQRERPCRGSGLTSGIRALAADNDIAPAAGDGTPMSGIGDCALASGDSTLTSGLRVLAVGIDGAPVASNNGALWLVTAAPLAGDGEVTPGVGASALASDDATPMSGPSAIALSSDSSMLTSGFSGRTLMSKVRF